MSINTIIAVILAVAGLGGTTVLAATNPTFSTDFARVQSEITNNNLAGYKSAKTQLINSRASSQINEINSTTQEDLNKISERQVKKTAVKNAITINDYNAFKASADEGMLKRVPDQASFDKLVANQKTRTESLAKINEAIKNNDFNSFKVAKESIFADRLNDNKKNDKKPSLTDEMLKTKFDKFVADYKANGSLPSQKNEINHSDRKHRNLKN